MNFAALRSLAEGATGYHGGSFRDELPEMTLSEAMSQLPIVCLEGQREFISLSENHTTALIEAAVSVAGYGDVNRATAPIVEASLEGIKKKIKEVFEKIKKFIRSIIDKLKVAIDKMRMSGHQLWSKYQDSKALKQDFSKADFSIQGYKFTGAGMLIKMGDWNSIPKIEELIKDSIKGDFKLPKDFESDIVKAVETSYSRDSSGAMVRTETEVNKTGEGSYTGYKDTTKGEAKDANKVVDSLKNSSQKEREKAIVSKITGITLSGDDWQSALKKKLYGEKVEIKYGKEGFNYEGIKKVLGEDSQLDNIKEQYVELEGTVGEYQKQLEDSLDKVKERISSNDSDKDIHTNENNALNIVSNYYSAYIAIVNQTISLISSVKNINWSFEKARYDQAKAMLGKMLSYKAPTNNSDASDVDDVDLAMIDFDL